MGRCIARCARCFAGWALKFRNCLAVQPRFALPNHAMVKPIARAPATKSSRTRNERISPTPCPSRSTSACSRLETSVPQERENIPNSAKSATGPGMAAGRSCTLRSKRNSPFQRRRKIIITLQRIGMPAALANEPMLPAGMKPASRILSSSVARRPKYQKMTVCGQSERV